MKADSPSSTALLIAASTLFLRNEAQGAYLVSREAADYCAQFLRAAGPPAARVVDLVQKGWFRQVMRMLESITIPGIQAHYALRKRYVRDWTVRNIREGYQQIVELGAGFDTLSVELHARLPEALPYSLFSWIDPPAARKYRIQKRRLTAIQVFWPALGRLVINMAAILAVVVLCWPLLKHSGIHAGQGPDWREVLWQIPAFLLIDDFLYYWLHRALHTRWLYKHIHSVHHRVSAPWAISAAHFHPVEYLLITATALTGPILLGAHVVTIWIWLILRQWEAAEGHSGYEFPWNPTRWLPGYQGPAFHDFHHAEFVGNYANFFGVLDRLFGTLAKGYVDFRARQNLDRIAPA